MRAHTTYHFQRDDTQDDLHRRKLIEAINILGQFDVSAYTEAEGKAVVALGNGFTRAQAHLAIAALIREAQRKIERHAALTDDYSREVVKQTMAACLDILVAYAYIMNETSMVRQ
ncbi:hypothetical protein UFOVP1040_26 [uncultured Caudovirales phage]|uniref:Uncharacterized protein n=1 Tax=uncultured Caudovirales phage TaxID=2100421 RepID=A0A6J5Q7Q4_9CAUD|nr:hypothetical protein UFOVP1040_26 [uncultured Caudovirales phage]